MNETFIKDFNELNYKISSMELSNEEKIKLYNELIDSLKKEIFLTEMGFNSLEYNAVYISEPNERGIITYSLEHECDNGLKRVYYFKKLVK